MRPRDLLRRSQSGFGAAVLDESRADSPHGSRDGGSPSGVSAGQRTLRDTRTYNQALCRTRGRTLFHRDRAGYKDAAALHLSRM